MNVILCLRALLHLTMGEVIALKIGMSAESLFFHICLIPLRHLIKTLAIGMYQALPRETWKTCFHPPLHLIKIYPSGVSPTLAQSQQVSIPVLLLDF